MDAIWSRRCKFNRSKKNFKNKIIGITFIIPIDQQKAEISGATYVALGAFYKPKQKLCIKRVLKLLKKLKKR